MRQLIAFAIVLLFCLPAEAQVRQKKNTPADFDGLLKASGEAFHQQDFGTCISRLQDAISLAAAQHHAVILAAMPPAPSGFTKQESTQQQQNNPFGGAMAGSIGLVVEQSYNQQGGNGHISVTVTANSPMVGMFEAMFRMAGMDPDLEVVEYNEFDALFKTENGGKKFNLQMPLFGKHFLDITATGLDEDTFFATFSQKFVDALAAAMGS